MRVVFFGTPEFAVPSLRALLGEGFDVLAAVTQPDRPQGRSRSQVVPPPVKVEAEAEAIPVLQPERPTDRDFLDRLRELAPDVGVVVAYGHILKPELLRLPPRGMVNVHPSLLPELRGAAPVEWAILNGVAKTGVSIMQLDEGLDSGPVLLQIAHTIEPDETGGELAAHLAEIGAQALVEALALWERDALRPVPQDHARASYAPKLTRDTARIRWDDPAERVARELGRVAGAGMVLRDGAQRIPLPQRQRLDEGLRADLGEMCGELPAGFVRLDRVRDLEQDGPGVEALVELQDTDARLGHAVQDRPLDRRRSAQLGEEGRMHVDHATGREPEQLRLQDMPVRDHDADIRSELPEPVEEAAVGRALRLEHRDRLRLGFHFHGRRYDLRAGAALRPVGLGDGGEHVEPLPEQRSQRRDREFRRAEENDAHLELARRLRRHVLEIPRLPLAGLLPLRDQQMTLHGAQVIEEQDAIEVIDFVLRGARLEAGELDRVRLAVAVERCDGNGERALHIAVDVGNREATLLGRFDGVAQLDDPGVDQHERWRELLAHVDDRNSPRDAHLVRGEPHAFGRAHGVEEVVHQPPDLVVHGCDRRRRLTQHRRAQQVEPPDRHCDFASMDRLRMLAMFERTMTKRASPLFTVTSSSFRCTTSPRIPPDVSTLSPFCREASSWLWRSRCFFCGRRIMK